MSSQAVVNYFPSLEGGEGIAKSIEQLRHRAANCEQRIILTDGEDPRILAAVCNLQRFSRLQFLLIGQTSVILSQAKRLGIADEIEIYDPLCNPLQGQLTQLLQVQFERRGKPVPDAATLKRMALDPTYAGVLLLKAGLADGMVGGAQVPTANVIRAGLQVIGIDRKNPVVSGAFIMLLAEKLPAGQNALVFADSAVIPQPSVEQLASITINTAQVTRAILGQEPIIALLSFSTHGSSADPSITKMVSALQLVRQQAPDLCVDGEMQLDAALIPEISASKAPGNLVKGRANVLIFPNLDAGNIAYKLLERVGHATALGVILSGLAKPINDLSRGCSVDDVMNIVAVTALQSTYGNENQLLSA
jgi:phosphate acetyltransferase